MGRSLNGTGDASKRKHFISQKDAAAYLNVSVRTLQRYTKRRRIKHAIIGRRVLYTETWLEEFCDSVTIVPLTNTSR